MNAWFKDYLRSEILELARAAPDDKEKEEARKLWEELTGEEELPNLDDLRSPTPHEGLPDFTQEEEPAWA